MTLDVKSLRLIKNKVMKNTEFSQQQLEILKDEFAKKCANDEVIDLRNSNTVNDFRKKYCVSKRDALDLIARSEQY